jgi:hypothetical protein
MKKCTHCNIELTDDILYTDTCCAPCYQDIISEEYIDHLIKTHMLTQCGKCGNIWDGNAQCCCYIFDEPEHNTDNLLLDSPRSITKIQDN